MKKRDMAISLLTASLIMVFPACEKSKQAFQTQITEMSTNPSVLSTETVGKSPDLSTGETMKVRRSALAGQWYSNKANELRTSIETYLQDAPDLVPAGSDIRALVVPHAGHYWSGSTAAVGYNALDISKYRRVFILCPNHRMPVHGTVSVTVDAFETPFGKIMVDKPVLENWSEAGLIHLDDVPHREEHAIEIQLPFIQMIFKGHSPTIVPLIVGEQTKDDAKKLGDALRSELKDDDLVIISTDLMHYGANYGYVPFGSPVMPQIREYDAATIASIAALDAQAFEAYANRMPHAACGLNPLRILSYAFENSGLKGVELAYDTSGRRSGATDMSVSYVAMAIVPEDQASHIKSPQLASEFTSSKTSDDKAKVIPFAKDDTPVSEISKAYAHNIVKLALEAAVDEQNTTPYPEEDIELGPDPDVFKHSYGVFVTLHDSYGQLRGCIGNIIPVSSLAQSLWGRAQDAALNDPRFEPLQPEELSRVTVEISVLTPARPIQKLSEIVLGRHGIIFKKGPRTSVFLPQVPLEQGWNVEQTLNALARKAGLPANAWRDGASFSVFEAQVF